MKSVHSYKSGFGKNNQQVSDFYFICNIKLDVLSCKTVHLPTLEIRGKQYQRKFLMSFISIKVKNMKNSRTDFYM